MAICICPYYLAIHRNPPIFREWSSCPIDWTGYLALLISRLSGAGLIRVSSLSDEGHFCLSGTLLLDFAMQDDV